MLEKTKLMKLKDKVQLLEADHPDILDENNEFPSGTDLTLNGTGDLEMSVDVGGNSTQVQYEGYNLFDKDNYLYYNGYFIGAGTSTIVSENANKIIYIPCSSNTQYTASKIISKRFGIGYTTEIPNANVSVYNVDSNNSGTSISITTGDNAEYLVVYIRNGNISGEETLDNIINSLQIIEGSTSKPYEPFVGNQASPNPTYKQDINNVEGDVVVKGSSKNLFDEDNVLKNTLLAWATAEIAPSNGSIVSDYIPVSNITNITSNYYFYIFYFDKNKNYLGNSEDLRTSVGIVYNSTTIVDNSNIKYFRLVYRPSSGNNPTDMTIVDIMVNKGTVATSYVPFGENSVTFPLSQGQKLMLGDTLEDDGIHHKRGKIVLDGTENWTNYTTQIEGYYKAYCTTKKTTALFGILTGLCTHFKIADVSLTVTQAKNLLGSNQYALYISISNNVASNVTELKTYLAEQYANGTPVTVEYELKEETIEPYTQTQQTAYNKLKEMQSYYDLTYVVGSSDNAQPIITAHAKKSLKVMNDEISNINSRLTLLEE